MTSRTFIMIKPDATERNLVGSLLGRFESAGFTITALRSEHRLDKAAAEFLYAEHLGKKHFPDLVAYTMSGPVVLAVLESPADDAVAKVRDMMGPSDVEKAAPGTLRRDFGVSYRKNSIHGSDGPEAAAREIAYFFPYLD